MNSETGRNRLQQISFFPRYRETRTSYSVGQNFLTDTSRHDVFSSALPPSGEASTFAFSNLIRGGNGLAGVGTSGT